jgi:CRISPR type I-E-associated protein CasB/Cse2
MSEKFSVADRARITASLIRSRIDWLRRQNDQTVRRTLAELRRGLGKSDMVFGLDFLLRGLDEDLLSGHDDELRVTYAILTLFAKHQQGFDIKTACVDKENVNIGKALRSDNETAEKRFQVLITSADRAELLEHLKAAVSIMGGGGLDYAALAGDVYRFAYPEYRDRIRLNWGKSFYMYSKNNQEDE